MHENNLLTRDEYDYCCGRLRGYVVQNTINIHHGKSCKKCSAEYGCDVVTGYVYLRYGNLYFPETKKIISK